MLACLVLAAAAARADVPEQELKAQIAVRTLMFTQWPANVLPPGEALPFRSRLASPPAEASGVTVRFFNRRDAQAGFM